MCSPDIFLGLLAMLFPPLPVWVKRGICSADSLINILLCTLGYIPGLIHAWYIIAKFPEQSYDYEAIPQDAEGGRVTGYVIVHEGRRVQGQRVGGQHNQQPRPQPPPKPVHQQGYGTTNNNNNNNNTNKPGAGPAAAPVQRDSGEGSSDANQAPPPSYAQVVAGAGDHKVQTQD
ncbi:hypothetical protein DL546_007816 [Coniochaeta pulveracea]|uniref:Plasma membrane proteolipid Pmp3 n=1 Tax=Coniochaeta pulveracea TaxID=177199 RepID=A0A420YH35_9PEZI|nr:hypothetical protein DL546_007816 [Coniochaeta pulveracea]